MHTKACYGSVTERATSNSDNWVLVNLCPFGLHFSYIFIFFSLFAFHGLSHCVQLSTRDADKSLARPGRKQARQHVRNERDFNNIETRAVIKFFFLQGKGPKENHIILIGTLAYLLPGRAKVLSAPLYQCRQSLLD